MEEVQVGIVEPGYHQRIFVIAHLRVRPAPCESAAFRARIGYAVACYGHRPRFGTGTRAGEQRFGFDDGICEHRRFLCGSWVGLAAGAPAG